MKWRKTLPLKFFKKLGQRGQAVIEFVLLLAVMATITYAFTYYMNKNLRRYWEYSINLIINDRPGTKTVTLP